MVPFGTRKQLMYALLGDGIFVQEGPDWKHSRELLRPQFNFREYGDLTHFSGPMEDLLRCISTTLMDPTSNRIVDLQPLFFRYTLDTTTSFLFGKSIESLKSGDKAVKFEEAFNVTQTIMAKRFRVAAFWPLVGGKELRDACKLVHDFTDEILERANEHNGVSDSDKDSRYVFLDKVAKEIPDLRHPEVLRKLRTEIMETLSGKETLNRNDLRQVKYLTDVLKETLRLYPSVPLNMKTAVRTTCLPTGGGPDRKSPVLVKKGEDVSFSPYALHRRKDLYGEDAEEFRPESLEIEPPVPVSAFNLLTGHFSRWQEDLPLFRDELTKTWGYLPFNGGPRVCLGMDFAMTEAAYAVVKILQRYPNITLPPHEKVVKTGQEKQAITLVIAPEEGCRLVFDDRL
ncbi:cytochrome P450 alkane hydroxylase protein [Rutstroemia sp. NJR-2017a BVV2]|nr:cytochrome P450 alkane hydroxylase protein [Rutstroemia sp. NJR-2017a BVV2]